MISLSIGRYHFLEQARALAGLGVAGRHYCDDPRVLSLGLARGRWMAGVAGEYAWRRRRDPLGAHRRAGERLREASARHEGVRINAAFALETLRAGRPVLVDHGSLDERHVRRVLGEEAAAWGEPLMAGGGNHGNAWMVERQAEEFERAAGIVVASELARRTLTGEGVAGGKIRVAPLGVDLERFRPEMASTAPRPFRFLHAGPVSFNKGVHRLIRAFREARLAGAELWIAGRFANEASERWLRRQASGLSVRFLAPVAQRQLPGLFAACDTFVLASLADGFGLTVLQALACGMPAIVSRQAGCAELLEGSSAVRVVEAGVVELGRALGECRHALRESLRGTGRAELAGACRATAARFSWAVHARRLVKELGDPPCSNF